MSYPAVEFTPKELMSMSLYDLLPKQSIDVNGWRMFKIEPGFVFFKGMDVPLQKMKYNADETNPFCQSYTWVSTPDVAYAYALRSLAKQLAANQPIAIQVNGLQQMDYNTNIHNTDVGVYAFKTTRPLYLYDIFSAENHKRLLNSLFDTFDRTGDKIYNYLWLKYVKATGYGIEWNDFKKKSVASGDPRGLANVETFTWNNQSVVFKYGDEIFGPGSKELNRASFMSGDVSMCDAIRYFTEADGYIGHASPSLWHRHNIFHQEVALFYPKYTLEYHPTSPITQDSRLWLIFQHYRVAGYANKSYFGGQTDVMSAKLNDVLAENNTMTDQSIEPLTEQESQLLHAACLIDVPIEQNGHTVCKPEESIVGVFADDSDEQFKSQADFVNAFEVKDANLFKKIYRRF